MNTLVAFIMVAVVNDAAVNASEYQSSPSTEYNSSTHVFRSEIARHHDGTVFSLRDFYPVSQVGGAFSSLHHQHIGFCFVLFFKISTQHL